MTLEELETTVRALDWKAQVPDDIQSEVRMEFNEALAGGPNTNGDAGPTLTPNHALDCVWATQRIQSQSDRIAEDEATIRLQAQRLMELSSEIVELRATLTKEGQASAG